ncbi:MAG: amino-acid N-acetyltransferase [Actinomycetaceae bacterium]|nr:amino-acid N-acetyltransferase [Actinomycetaceae bacterium]
MTKNQGRATRGKISIRTAKPADARHIEQLARPYADRKILVDKRLIAYFEDIQEFLVAVDENGNVVGCGALHVMWDDIGEVRTLAVLPSVRGQGVGSRLLTALVSRARQLELQRVFCLTFEVEFFSRHGFEPIEGMAVGVDVYTQMLASHDDGVKNFLELASVKPNTLGNTRMMKTLTPPQ